MSQPDGSIYVDPDGVIKTGGLYGEHATTYAGHLAYIEALRSHYGSSWGSDEMGRKFGESFVKGMNALELVIKGTVGMLEYTSDGLRAGGRDYRAADEDALDAGRTLLRHSEKHPPAGAALRSGAIAATPPTTSQLAMPTAGVGPTAGPDTLRSGAIAATPPTTSKLAIAEQPGRLVASAGTAPIESATLRAMATPAVPAYDERDLSGAHVGGQPLSGGQRLVAFASSPDGTVHVDANLYESVTPVAGSAVTTGEGRPIDPDGRQFFVVRDASGIDPVAPGYRPFQVTYPAVGNQPSA